MLKNYRTFIMSNYNYILRILKELKIKDSKADATAHYNIMRKLEDTGKSLDHSDLVFLNNRIDAELDIEVKSLLAKRYRELLCRSTYLTKFDDDLPLFISLRGASKHTRYNTHLLDDPLCCCYGCCGVYNAKEHIKIFCDSGKTLVCPCLVDAVIPIRYEPHLKDIYFIMLNYSDHIHGVDYSVPV